LFDVNGKKLKLVMRTNLVECSFTIQVVLVDDDVVKYIFELNVFFILLEKITIVDR